ncbi:MAG: 30S ribosomal protein S8 [Gemmatimonadota bacterium]|nr:MAG: 30S ribosomal protein S8 [Gemmatimonadota bacterium]
MMTDPVADILTRLRNACHAKYKKVDVPASILKREIARILVEQKFINSFTDIEKDRHPYLRLYLRYDANEMPIISGLQRVSTPGRRKYVAKDKVPKVLNGLGVAIMSTSKGILTDKQTRELGIGGEVLCYIW